MRTLALLTLLPFLASCFTLTVEPRALVLLPDTEAHVACRVVGRLLVVALPLAPGLASTLPAQQGPAAAESYLDRYADVMTLDAVLGLYGWHGRHHVGHVASVMSRSG